MRWCESLISHEIGGVAIVASKCQLWIMLWCEAKVVWKSLLWLANCHIIIVWHPTVWMEDLSVWTFRYVYWFRMQHNLSRFLSSFEFSYGSNTPNFCSIPFETLERSSMTVKHFSLLQFLKVNIFVLLFGCWLVGTGVEL